MTEDEYKAAIRQIPLFYERDTEDGTATICRDINNLPVYVAKPESLAPEDRVAAVELYRELYSPARH